MKINYIIQIRFMILTFFFPVLIATLHTMCKQISGFDLLKLHSRFISARKSFGIAKVLAATPAKYGMWYVVVNLRNRKNNENGEIGWV